MTVNHPHKEVNHAHTVKKIPANTAWNAMETQKECNHPHGITGRQIITAWKHWKASK
jgi:hypothetical protein